jgi:hypothetical protein
MSMTATRHQRILNHALFSVLTPEQQDAVVKLCADQGMTPDQIHNHTEKGGSKIQVTLDMFGSFQGSYEQLRQVLTATPGGLSTKNDQGRIEVPLEILVRTLDVTTIIHVLKTHIPQVNNLLVLQRIQSSLADTLLYELQNISE